MVATSRYALVRDNEARTSAGLLCSRDQGARFSQGDSARATGRWAFRRHPALVRCRGSNRRRHNCLSGSPKQTDSDYHPCHLAGNLIGSLRQWDRVCGPASTAIAAFGKTPPPDDAEAPTVAIAPIGTVDEGATQSLTATLTGGVYDGLAYLWEVVSGGGTISNATSANATYNAPAVASDTPAQVRLTVTATGTGTNAADGTSDDGTDTEDFTVANVAAITTDTDSIYILSATAPATPTGGTTVEDHTPAGWTRTQPTHRNPSGLPVAAHPVIQRWHVHQRDRLGSPNRSRRAAAGACPTTRPHPVSLMTSWP